MSCQSTQLAQKVVDLYLDGQRNAPPFPQRQELQPIMESWFKENGTPMPETADFVVLVNVEVGILQDQFPNGPMAARVGVGAVLASGYVKGQLAVPDHI